MSKNCIHKAYNLVTNLQIPRRNNIRQIGIMPRTACSATTPLYNDLYAVHADCVSDTGAIIS
eukprot:9074402-Karenia_brevis.AAC.1